MSLPGYRDGGKTGLFPGRPPGYHNAGVHGKVEMNNLWKPDAVAEVVLVPLAEAFESFVEHADEHARKGFRITLKALLCGDDSVTLNNFPKLQSLIEIVREYFAYQKSPSYADYFKEKVTDAICRYAALSFPLLSVSRLRALALLSDEKAFNQYYEKFEAECDLFARSDKYLAAIASAADAAFYLRQLVSMMVDEGSSDEPPKGLPEGNEQIRELVERVRLMMSAKPKEKPAEAPKQKCNLPPKKLILDSKHFVGLTECQSEVVSLRLEYGFSFYQIGKRLGKNTKTVSEHYKAAEKRMNLRDAQQRAMKNQAKSTFRATDDSKSGID